MPIQLDTAFYLQKGIALEFENKVTPWEFMRGFIPEQSNLFWLTRQDISAKIPLDIPEFMTLTNWHHPNLGICVTSLLAQSLVHYGIFVFYLFTQFV